MGVRCEVAATLGRKARKVRRTFGEHGNGGGREKEGARPLQIAPLVVHELGFDLARFTFAPAGSKADEATAEEKHGGGFGNGGRG